VDIAADRDPTIELSGRRQTTLRPSHRNRALDGLRGVAVLAVLTYHGSPWFCPAGWIGVDVFFVLSGFLITTLLVAERSRTGRVALRAFYGRRARRLLPAMLVAVAFGVLVASHWPNSAADTYRQALATMFDVGNWGLVTAGHVSLPLAHTWSLGVEEQFYIVWPLALVLMLRMRRGLGAAFVLASCGALASLADRLVADPANEFYRTDTHADGLLLGCALAIALAAGWTDRIGDRLLGAGALIGGAVLALLTIWAVLPDWQHATVWQGIEETVVALAAAAVILAAYRGSRATALLGNRALVWVGRRSYGLYLYHWIVMVQVALWLGTTRDDRVILFAAPTSSLAAAISWRYLELPIMRQHRRGAEDPKDATAPDLALPAAVSASV
jgi:peptidoglycan/LPS O-acetylase OafA/YrhL